MLVWVLMFVGLIIKFFNSIEVLGCLLLMVLLVVIVNMKNLFVRIGFLLIFVCSWVVV